MRRYTTPTLTLRIDGEGLAGCDVYVTLTQGETEITVTGEECTSVDVDDSGMTVRLQLTQEQTARFEPRRSVLVQGNLVDGTGHRQATEIQRVSVWDNLLAHELAYEGQDQPSGGGGGGTTPSTGYGIDVTDIDGEQRMVFADFNEQEVDDG